MTRFILFVLLISISSQASAQSLPRPAPDTITSLRADSTTRAVLVESSAGHIIWHDIKDGWCDLGHYIVRPLDWDVREWAILGTGVAFTAMLALVDDVPIRNLVQNNRGKVADQFVEFGNDFYGNGYATGLTFLSLYTVGLETNNDKLRIMGLHVLQSFAYAGMTTTAMKIVLGRTRPFLDQGGAFAFHGFSLNNIWNSLPSGHVTVASALSESLASDIDNTWVTAVLYSFIAWTAYSRIYADAHWLSDTFLAGVVGTASGYWVTHQPDHYDMKTNDPKPTSFEIEPSLGGVSLAYHF
jgi:membrane-associated phospholipid phosphatase